MKTWSWLVAMLAGAALAVLGCGEGERCPALETGLPRSYAECVEAGGLAYQTEDYYLINETILRCEKVWVEAEDSAGYSSCTKAGGSSVEGQAGACRIRYRLGECPCLGPGCE